MTRAEAFLFKLQFEVFAWLALMLSLAWVISCRASGDVLGRTPRAATSGLVP